jgi:hypothetical protein
MFSLEVAVPTGPLSQLSMSDPADFLSLNLPQVLSKLWRGVKGSSGSRQQTLLDTLGDVSPFKPAKQSCCRWMHALAPQVEDDEGQGGTQAASHLRTSQNLGLLAGAS